MRKIETDNIINKLHNVLKFCKDKNIRILIELDPNYDNIYIHTDIWSQFYVQKELAKNEVDTEKKVIFTITNEKMYYPKEQDINVLRENRETKSRFYNSNIDVSYINWKEYKLILVPVHGKFEQKVIRKIKSIFSFGWSKNIVEEFNNLELPAEYKKNIAYNNRFIVYRY